jgi:exonuclease VII large subunit
VLTGLEDGRVIQDASQAPAGSQLRARLAKGSLNVKVQESFTQEA